MSNLFWQPPKPWTLARLLVGCNRSHFLCSNRRINTIVCFLGMGSGCFSALCGSSKLHNVLMWSRETEKHRATNPHWCPCGEFSHAYFIRKWTGVLFLPALAPSTLTAPFSSGEEGSAQGFSTAADDSWWKSPFEPDLRSFPKFILTHWFLPFESSLHNCSLYSRAWPVHRYRPHQAAGPGCSPGLQGHLLPILKPHPSLSCSTIPKDKLLHPCCLLGTGRKTSEKPCCSLGLWKITGWIGLSQCFPALSRGAWPEEQGCVWSSHSCFSLRCFLRKSTPYPCLLFYSSTQALEAHTEPCRLQVLTDIPVSSFLPKMAQHMALLLLLLCFPLPSRGGSEKGTSIWILAIRAGARSSCWGMRKPFLKELGRAHHWAPPQWCVRMTSFCQ